MKKQAFVVFENDGVLYFLGKEVKPGDSIELNGVNWQVVGGGRSTDRKQTPFLWVKHEKFGTSIFAPSLGFSLPHKAARPTEKSFVPKVEYANVWKQNPEKALLEYRLSEIQESAKIISAEMTPA